MTKAPTNLNEPIDPAKLMGSLVCWESPSIPGKEDSPLIVRTGRVIRVNFSPTMKYISVMQSKEIDPNTPVASEGVPHVLWNGEWWLKE